MDEYSLSTVLPHNAEAEQVILGACLHSIEALDQLFQSNVKVEEFFRPFHRRVFATLGELFEGSEPVLDLVTVSDALRHSKDGLSEEEMDYLLEISEATYTVAGLKAYIDIIREKAILRKLLRTTNDIKAQINEGGEDIQSILEGAEHSILDIAEDKMARSVVPLGELVDEALLEFKEIVEHKKAPDVIKTGFPDLDETLHGFYKNNLIILASRPGMGKTALGLNIAQRVAIDSGVGVAFFSLEMSNKELVNRILCSEARVESQLVRKGLIGIHELKSFEKAAGKLSDAPFFIDDTPALSVMELRAKARRLVRSQNVGLIVVDYLQLMTVSHRRIESRQMEVAEISRSLKRLAMDLKIPVLAMAQLNRGPTQRTGSKLPQLSELRESGAIEQDADVVMFLHREEYYKTSEMDDSGAAPEDEDGGSRMKDFLKEDGASVVKIAKQRNGPIGTALLWFKKKISRFESVDPRYLSELRGGNDDDEGGDYHVDYPDTAPETDYNEPF